MKSLGIGIDVVDIRRFRKLPYKSNRSFYKKIFSQSEIKYCLNHRDSSLHFAGKFAVKEAVKKSIQSRIQMSDIITGHRVSKPTVRLQKNNSYDFLVSLSHESDIAVAVVISERRIR